MRYHINSHIISLYCTQQRLNHLHHHHEASSWYLQRKFDVVLLQWVYTLCRWDRVGFNHPSTVSVFASIFTSNYSAAYLYIHPSIYSSIHSSSTYPTIISIPSIQPSIHPYPSIHLSIHLYIIPMYLSIHVSILGIHKPRSLCVNLNPYSFMRGSKHIFYIIIIWCMTMSCDWLFWSRIFTTAY